MTETGSTVPRRQLGRYLREAREKAAISVVEAAKQMEWSRDRLYRVEAGRVAVRKHEVVALCAIYNVPSHTTDVLTSLASATRDKGWWHSYGEVVPTWFDLYLGLEAAATRLRWYEAALIPGLLQVPAYAAAVLGLDTTVPETEVTQNVELRMQRQQLLARATPPPPKLEVIIGEAVLRQPIQDRDGMRHQLAHLIYVQRERDVEIRVLPMAVGPHLGSRGGAFVILEFRGSDNQAPEPTTVYTESLTGALYLDKRAEVAEFDATWQAMLTKALSVTASIGMIKEIQKET